MKTDKKQYNLRLPKDDLKRLQELSIKNDTSVSHEIRQSIREHLKLNKV